MAETKVDFNDTERLADLSLEVVSSFSFKVDL
jgi:hypothetical protein